MDDYRALHRAKYLEREQERLELERKRKKMYERVEKLKTYKTMNTISKTLGEIIEGLELVEKPKLTEFGLSVLQAINGNPSVTTNFHKPKQVQTSTHVQEGVKQVLTYCGIEGLEINYEMDCSRDEEIARNLAR
jgi:hypothetical protein